MSRTLSAPQFVCNLNVSSYSRDSIGGKALSLGYLHSLGVPVPSAFALTTDAYRLHVRRLGIPECASAVEPAELPSIRAAIVGATISAEIRDHLQVGIGSIRHQSEMPATLAVRSSATTEDSPEFSFAGLHDTALSVADNIDAVELAVKTCWSSLWSERSVDYRRRGGESLDTAAMAVVVQRLVRSDVSFVAFSVDPVDYCSNRIIISATYGLGEAVVSGLVTPDHIVINPDGEIEVYQTGAKEMMIIPAEGGDGVRQVPVPRFMSMQHALSDDQVVQIGRIVRRLEAAFDTPLDIEGGIAGGEMYLFQARPITTCQHLSMSGTRTTTEH